MQMTGLYICHEMTDMMTYDKQNISGNCCSDQILCYSVPFDVVCLTFCLDV